MPCQSHTARLKHSSYTSRRAEILKLLSLHFSSVQIFSTAPCFQTTSVSFFLQRATVMTRQHIVISPHVSSYRVRKMYYVNFHKVIYFLYWAQWPFGTRHETSSGAKTQGNRLVAWASACFYSAFMLCCVGSDLWSYDHPSKVSHQLSAPLKYPEFILSVNRSRNIISRGSQTNRTNWRGF
jgi:hypothetical protein